MTERDTIFALSSGRPPAAIAVVRISGPSARVALERLAGRVPEGRRASLARLRHPVTEEPLDDALVLWLPGPKTETGEDMVELHLHGGRAVIAGVLQSLGAISGLRPAEAGEFTRRSFENGRLDLTAVEGLADLIAADTEAQRRLAYRQLSGVLGQRAEAWRARVIEALALAEACIDFVDEGDVPETLAGEARGLARALAADIEEVLRADRRGERLREGLVVAIAGTPNVGKSSLLNRIARREAAIVSPYAGTTRDVIEVHLDLDGYPVTLLDTAGIRDSEDPVEAEGVRRARARAAAADLVLWVVEAGQGVSDAAPAHATETWIVVNKIDLIDSAMQRSATDRFGPESKHFWLSARTGEGVEGLLAALGGYAEGCFLGAESALISRERHRLALREASEALRRAVSEEAAGREDIVAEELRLSARALGRLTGRVDVEDVLDVIFRDFCIGK